jgi:choline dehydrogenase-like flavoprotein
MIIRSNDYVPCATRAATTVCIVGAGPAGITLACELDGAGYTVLLLEAGGFKPEPAVSDDHVGISHPPHPATTEFRRATLGGTSGIWGGRCVPLDPIDFEARDYVAASGWPIAYAEVARFYPRAMAYCDAGQADFSVAGSLPAAAPSTIGDLNDAAGVLLGDRIERYSLPTDFGKRYRQRLAASANVTVLLYARCTGLRRDAGDGRIGRIGSVDVVDQAGRTLSISAEVVVLAGGGIEIPRLLLAADRNGTGLGNQHDNVGRYYGCHFENTVGRVVPGPGGIPFQFETTSDGVYCRRKLQFSAAAQRRHRLLNTAFRFHFTEYGDASHGSAVMSGIFLVKSALLPEYRAILHHNNPAATDSPASAHLRNVARRPHHLVRFGCQWLIGRVLAERKLPYTLVANADGSYPLEFNCEQTPLASNRITLDGTLDRHGMPRASIAWRLPEEDVDAALRGFAVLRDTLHHCSGSRLHFDAATLREQLAASVPLGGHHIGTTRMAATPHDGVVDTNCAVFGLANLFIAGAAVFPTSGHANPTLTIVALALRLGEHLKAQLARR